MTLKIIPALFLFLGSYLPLSIILLVHDIDDKTWNAGVCLSFPIGCNYPSLKNPTASISFFILCALICIFLIRYFLIRNTPTDEVLVNSAKPIPNDLINYVFPYVVSLMGWDFSDGRKVVGFLIFFLWMFLITYRSGQILMNPVILLSKWKLYEAKVTYGNQEHHVRMLSTDHIADRSIHKSCIVHGVYILSKKEEGAENE